MHIDTLDPERLPGIMRWGRFEQVWRGVEAAVEAGLVPLKLNAVIARGFNDEDVTSLAGLTLEPDWHPGALAVSERHHLDKPAVAPQRSPPNYFLYSDQA